jgi:hypothetical protein
LRNAGNIITGPMSSTMRSLALACVVKGGKEIVIIGHTDCQVGKMTVLELIDRFRALGIERHVLPDNLNEYFGLFGSVRQNVLKAVEVVRQSPLIGPKIPVQGLVIDIETGKLEWLVNGYQTVATSTSHLNQTVHTAPPAIDPLKPIAGFNLEAMKFPEGKIGELISAIGQGIAQKLEQTSESASDQSELSKAGKFIARLSGPEGFKVGEIKVPESKIGEVVSEIGREISHEIAHGLEGLDKHLKAAQPPRLPPKIPQPPRLKPKVQLRRNPND